MAHYDRKDHLYKRAKEEGYRSRAAYKLIEIDKKYQLFRPGMKVLDLGCFPGGWLQVAMAAVSPSGLVIGVDLDDVEPLGPAAPSGQTHGSRAIIIRGDATSKDVQAKIAAAAGGQVDLILSDMSPKLSGIKFRDAARSAELVETALEIARSLLKEGGGLVTKIFPGAEADAVFEKYRVTFGKVRRIDLEASRKTSNEFYFVAQDFRKG